MGRSSIHRALLRVHGRLCELSIPYAMAFSDPSEGRWQAARDFFATTQVGLVPVEAPAEGVPEAAGWLWQLFWGQRLTLHVCRGLGVDPDLMRKDDPRYRLGFERLRL